MALKEKLAASLLVATITFGAVGCQDINATIPIVTTTETTPATLPTTRPTITETTSTPTTTETSDVTTSPTTTSKPTTETTPTPTTTSKPTTETTPTPTTRPTTETTPTPTTTSKPTTETTPTPTTTEAPNELEGVAPERLEFTKDLLGMYDKYKSSDEIFGKIRTFLTRDQIINYGKTGEGLSVVKHKDGAPAVALINCDAKVTTAFNNMIKEMSTYDSNFLKKLTNNGLVTFMINKNNQMIDRSYTYSREGMIVWNIDSSTTNVVSANLKRPIGEECFGIKMANLGGDYSKYQGYLKEQLTSDCWWNLYKKTGDDLCQQISHGTYMLSKTLYLPPASEMEKVQNLLKNVRSKNLASSFGGSWSEISTSIVDRPDWQE